VSLLLERLDASNLRTVSRGCAVLAAGGGGDAGLSLLMALRAVDEHGAVPLVGLEDLPDDALVMPCGLIGAPAIATERIWSGDEGRTLCETMAELHGRPVTALMPYAIGGANGLLPVAWAARLGLPLVDADGMGRAFPHLHQQAMRLAGVDASPVVLTEARGNTIVLRTPRDGEADRLARGAAASLGGVCAGALFCMSGVQARSSAIGGSYTRALELGGRDARAAGNVLVAQARVVDLQPSAATLRGTGDDAGRQLRIELQDGYLLAIEDGAVRAAVPDVICLLEPGGGEAISTERLRHGNRVDVVVWPAPGVWRTGAGLAMVGPAGFGYDIEYARGETADAPA
jgi:DUF917 family protein